MSNAWFRMYAEFSTDVKVQSMSEAMQRRLVMLLCLRCGNEIETFHETEIEEMLCFSLRISIDELRETKTLFIRKGFINERWELVNWDKRQFVSNSSTARVREFRERKKRKMEDDETKMKRFSNALDTDTDTDTDNLSVISSDNKLSKDITSPPSQGDDVGFEEFWKSFPPNGASKADAKKAYAKAIKVADEQTIQAAISPYCQYLQQEKVKVAHATTWLKEQRWTVDYAAIGVKPGTAKPDPVPKTDEERYRMLKRLLDNGKETAVTTKDREFIYDYEQRNQITDTG